MNDQLLTKILNEGLDPKAINYSGRVDKFISNVLSGWSRSMIDRLVEGDVVEVNEKIVKKGSKRIRKGDLVRLRKKEFHNIKRKIQNELKLRNFSQSGDKKVIEPEDIPIEVVYENDNVLAVNKPVGMVVHPGAGNLSGTLVNAVAGYFQKHGIQKPRRVGLIHRLDKEVEGLILFAKNDWTLSCLSKQFSGKGVTSETASDLSKKALKKYWAIVGPINHNRLKKIGLKKNKWMKIEGYIRRNPNVRDKFEFNLNKPFLLNNKGRYSLSFARIKEELPNQSHFWIIEVHIVTGRTHQIRVQLSDLDIPICGDTDYGGVRIKKSDTIKLRAVAISYIPPTVYHDLSKTVRGGSNQEQTRGFQGSQALESLSKDSRRDSQRTRRSHFGSQYNFKHNFARNLCKHPSSIKTKKNFHLTPKNVHKITSKTKIEDQKNNPLSKMTDSRPAKNQETISEESKHLPDGEKRFGGVWDQSIERTLISLEGKRDEFLKFTLS